MSISPDRSLNIWGKLEQILPAQPCVLCGSMSRHGQWCADCDVALPYLNQPHCPICALPTALGEVCGHCLKSPPAFDRTLAVFAYRFPLDKLVKAMKYAEQLALSQIFAEKLLQRINHNHLPDYLIPMPLHPDKLRRRGFNQTLLVSAKLAHAIGKPQLVNACHRLRDTASQSALPWKERKQNVRNAFRCDMDLSGKRIALIDDVLTTGASLNALADSIKKCGAVEISTWVIARTLPHSPD